VRSFARLAVAALVVAGAAPACVQSSEIVPECREDDEAVRILTLAAQAVPSATVLPCLELLLPGWSFAGSQIVEGAFRFWLSSDRAGLQAVRVELLGDCDVTDAVEVIPGLGEAGTRRFEEPLSLSPRFAANRFYTFPGGCIRVEYRFGTRDARFVLEADQAIGFRTRQGLVDRYEEHDLVLCGAGAAECPGGE
jgi:hypothetical protein